MTWRRCLAALTIATFLAAAYGVLTPVLASVPKAALLAALQRDKSTVNGWVLAVGQMNNLGSEQAAIANDVSSAYASAAALYNKTLADTSATALSADSAQTMSLHASLASLEGPKIGLASKANNLRAQFDVLLRAIQSSGGLDLHSPIHAQTIAMLQRMQAAKADVDEAIRILTQATLSNYPASVSLLARARSLINQGAAALRLVDPFHLPLAGAADAKYVSRIQLDEQFQALSKLRAQVFTDQNLSAGERWNLLDEIDTGMVALAQLSRCTLVAANSVCLAQYDRFKQLGVFFLIRPKADIMLAAAADRSAIAGLTALLPTLRSHIAAAAVHHDVTHLNALLGDLTTQLAGASTDIAPIDAVFEPMTATTTAQRSHDAQVILTTTAALTDANNRLTTASSDATQIMAADV